MRTNLFPLALIHSLRKTFLSLNDLIISFRTFFPTLPQWQLNFSMHIEDQPYQPATPSKTDLHGVLCVSVTPGPTVVSSPYTHPQSQPKRVSQSLACSCCRLLSFGTRCLVRAGLGYVQLAQSRRLPLYVLRKLGVTNTLWHSHQGNSTRELWRSG